MSAGSRALLLVTACMGGVNTMRGCAVVTIRRQEARVRREVRAWTFVSLSSGRGRGFAGKFGPLCARPHSLESTVPLRSLSIESKMALRLSCAAPGSVSATAIAATAELGFSLNPSGSEDVESPLLRAADAASCRWVAMNTSLSALHAPSICVAW